MGIPTLCPFALLSGQPCPGCGMGRSLWSCLNGEIEAAFAVHPLGPPTFFCGLVFAALWASSARSNAGRRAFTATVRWTRRRPVWPTVLALSFGIWAARFAGAFGGPAPVHTPVNELLGTLFG